MNGPTIDLRRLSDDRPEWRPWLAVLDELFQEIKDLGWDDCVPAFSERRAHLPWLANASIVISQDRLRRWVVRLLRAAVTSGTAPLATLRQLAEAPPPLELFRAALRQDFLTLDKIAEHHNADAAALRGVAALLPIPFLHACSRHLSGSVAANWLDGYCPLCGAWPAFAEVRGIERARYLRCARCAAGWPIHWLYCPFCTASDHEQLMSLVAANGAASRSVEACQQCGAYVKSFTLLQPTEGFGVLLEDLASVDLDIAAIEQGYRRREGPGYALNILVGEQKNLRSRFFSWDR